MLCPERTAVWLCTPSYGAKLSAYVSEEAIEHQPDLPYYAQKGKFRLFYDQGEQASVGDVIDGQWSVVAVDNSHPGRGFCDCVRFSWRQVETVDVYRLISRPSPHARTEAQHMHEGLEVGHIETAARTEFGNDVAIPAGTHVFGVAKQFALGMEPDRTLFRLNDRSYLVYERRDLDRLDRCPLLLARESAQRYM